MTGPILIAAGGTGGHMFPALALGRALAGQGRRVTLVTDRRGARYVGEDLPFTVVSAGSPSGGVGRAAGPGPARPRLPRKPAGPAPRAAGRRRRLRRLRLGPGALAAAVRRVPLLVHEQNAVFGRANRLTARFARAVALSFEATADVPARPACDGCSPATRPARVRRPGGSTGRSDRFRVLVLGGSQGARVFSDVVPAALARCRPSCAPASSSPSSAGPRT